MTSYSEQFAAARSAHLAASTIEDQSRQQVGQAFQDWDSGNLDAQTVRHRLEAIVRASYRASVAVATEQAVTQAALAIGVGAAVGTGVAVGAGVAVGTGVAVGALGWRPKPVFNTPYLQSLLSDVRSNLRDYKASDRDEVARRRVLFRTEASVGTGAQRGYSDALVDAYGDLSENFGVQVRKFWVAGGSSPCRHCWELNGTEVGLDDAFPVPQGRKPYQDLLAPPLHPSCQCHLANLIVSLDNIHEPVSVMDPPTPAPLSMSADDVRNMDSKQFNLVVQSMNAVHSALQDA